MSYPVTSRQDLLVYYLGSLLVTALILGGGTQKGIYLDVILQLLALPLVISMCLNFRIKDHDVAVSSLALMMVMTFGLHLLPIQFFAQAQFVTLDVGRTLDSFLFCLTAFAFFHRVWRMDEAFIARLVPFFLLGVLLNVIVFLLQATAHSKTGIWVIFPFDLNAGLFANPNHMSSLIYCAIPFVIFGFRKTRWWALSIPVLGLAVLIQLILGSRAGVGLVILAIFVSYLALIDSTKWRLAIAGAIMLGGLLLFFLFPNWGALDTQFPLNRSVFASNTLDAIWDYFPWGSGFGTFPQVYPPYELQTGVYREFVNHAHNDYLELILEGGIAAGIIILGYLAVLAHTAMQPGLSDFQRISLCSISFLLLHSLVDYPLRTMALAFVFAFLNALFLSQRRTRTMQTALIVSAPKR